MLDKLYKFDEEPGIYGTNIGVDGHGNIRPWAVSPRVDLLYPEYIMMVSTETGTITEVDKTKWMWDGVESEEAPHSTAM